MPTVSTLRSAETTIGRGGIQIPPFELGPDLSPRQFLRFFHNLFRQNAGVYIPADHLNYAVRDTSEIAVPADASRPLTMLRYRVDPPPHPHSYDGPVEVMEVLDPPERAGSLMLCTIVRVPQRGRTGTVSDRDKFTVEHLGGERQYKIGLSAETVDPEAEKWEFLRTVARDTVDLLVSEPAPQVTLAQA